MIVEDSEDDTLLIVYELKHGGYEPAYERVETAGAMRSALGRQAWDVVISDYTLPQFSALAALQVLKESGIDLPFIVVTGTIGEETAVDIMKAGAHDYVMKINLKRLLPAIERELREVQVRRQRRAAEKALQQNIKKLRGALDQTAIALASAIEKRDPYTAGHSQKVAHLASAITREMGFEEGPVEGIHVGGVLHDIGKISIPAEILSKPGELSRGEFEIVKGHPEVGYEILKAIEFPWPVSQIALQHHERMNGSGYPAGLSAKEILLEARILSVADVVEAISSHRPYRPALGLEKALAEISDKRGTLYDPEVVEASLRLFNGKGFNF